MDSQTSEVFTPRGGTSGFGKDYEYLMAAYYGLIFTLNEDVVDFKLSTNNKDLGDFDDVVIEIEMSNGGHKLFALQLKHKVSTIALLKLTTNDKHFGLNKYIQEFKNIKTKFNKTFYAVPFKDIHFVLYTNTTLKDFEDIDERGKRLDTIINGVKVESETVIKRCHNPIGKELLKSSANEDSLIYQFSTSKQNSSEEDFFKQFSLYTKQKSAKEIASLIAEIIAKTFKTRGSDVAVNYCNYFNYWFRRDFGTFKLTKQHISMKITELILSPYIPEPNLQQLDKYSEEKFRLFSYLWQNFDILLFDDPTGQLINRLWTATLPKLQEFGVDWLQPLPGIYMSYFTDKCPLPISAQSDNFNEMTLKRFYLTLWHSGLAPLIIKSEDVITDQDILPTLTTCKSKSIRKIIAIMKEQFEDASKETVFRNLSDLPNTSIAFDEITKNSSVSLQGRPPISLKQFIEFDDRLTKTITLDKLISMLDQNSIIGDDCKRTLPQHYITRLIPKILLRLEAINAIDGDIFLMQCPSELPDVESCLNIPMIDVQKYLMLKPQVGTINYIPKQFSMAQWIKIQNQNNVHSDKLLVIVKGDCSGNLFEEVCSMNAGKSCHFVRFVDKENIEWIESYGTIKKLKRYRQDFKGFKSDQFVTDADAGDYFKGKINLICADAGMGKSVMINILQLKSSSNQWVINTNLNDHVIFFRESRSENQVFEYFFSLENSFARQVAEIFFSNKNVLFLWDGFDELPANCVQFAIRTIEELSLEGYTQWVSARLGSKKFLEDSFNTFSLTLTQFSVQNQSDYVYGHLRDKYDKDHVETIVGKMDQNISAALRSDYSNYTGIPLHIHMMVEIYLNNPDKHSDNREIITLTDIYEEFIQGKIDCLFNKAEANLQNYHMQQMRRQFKNTQLPLYEIASLKATFDEETFKALNLDCDELLEEVAEEEDMLGLIVKIDDLKKPVFAHKTYQEFLTASWLAKNYQKHPNLVLLMFQEEHRNKRLMFDMLLAKDSPAHLAVLYRNFGLLEKHKDEIKEAKDIAGRNTLHIACAWGREHPTVQDKNDNTGLPTVSRSSSEDDYKRYLQVMKVMAERNSEFNGLMEILTSATSRDEVNKFYNDLYKARPESPALQTAANQLMIFAETLVPVEAEDEIYMNMMTFLLDHRCPTSDTDKMLNWNAFQYADAALSLGAIDKMLNYEQININTLNNYSHIPTVVHYCISLFYDNLLKAVDSIPYIVYKYEFGTVSMLQFATEHNNLEAVSTLLTNKSYQEVINAQSAFKGNPLGSAIFNGNVAMIDLLLKHGAKVNEHGMPPLIIAAYSGQKDCCRKLLEAGADMNVALQNGTTALIAAVTVNKIDIATLLLNEGADINRTCNGIHALSFAVFRNNSEMVRLLLTYKPNLNSQDDNLGYTSLHYACQFGSLEIVKNLLDNGADTKIKSKTLLVPLHVALINKKEDVTTLLIERDSSVVNDYALDDKTQPILSPMSFAIASKLPEVIKALAQHGAYVNGTNGCSVPLSTAAAGGSDSCVRALLDVGASVNQTDDTGTSPLSYSVKNTSILNLLLDNSADVHSKNENGLTALHYAALSGSTESVAELVKKGADINAQDNKNHTPLFFSIQNKKTNIVEYLLKQGASLESGSELVCLAVQQDMPEYVSLLLNRGIDVDSLVTGLTSPLHSAVIDSPRCLQMLLEKGANPNISNPHSPLVWSLIFGNYEAMEQLIKAGADVNTKFQTMSVLHLAALLGDILSVVLLIRSGADVNVCSDEGQTPLHSASSESMIPTQLKLLSGLEVTNVDMCLRDNQEDCAKELILNGVNVNQSDNNGITPLHLACINKKTSLIKLFVENGADVNGTTHNDETPLLICCMIGSLEDVELLVQNGASLKKLNNSGKSPAVYVLERFHKRGLQGVKQMKILQSIGANIDLRDEEGFTFLNKAAYNGDLETVTYLLENGANIEHKTEQGATPLFYAVNQNHKTIVDVLLNRSCNVNTQNEDGNIALHFAASNGSLEIISLLCQAGSAVNVKNTVNGSTPLHYACLRGHYESCRILVKAGADINIVGHKVNTPLYNSVMQNHQDVMRFLVENGAGIDQMTFSGAVSLGNLETVKFLHDNCNLTLDEDELVHSAVNKDHECSEVLKYLLKQGANPNAVGEVCTPLQKACFFQYNDSADCLVRNGANVNAPGQWGITPLMSLYENKTLQIATLLVEYGANINQTNDNSKTALHCACSCGNLNLAKFLFKNGADLSIESCDGTIALLEAAEHIDVIKYLIENGSKINHKSKDGETILHRTCACNNFAAVVYLIENGADIDSTDENGLTPLHAAANVGNSDIVRLLLAINADVTLKTKLDHTPILQAVIKNHLEVVKVFAEELSHIEDKKYIEWQKSFLFAAALNRLDILKFLHENDFIRIDGREDASQYTALHYASLEGSYDSATYLIGNNADVNAKTVDGFVPLKFASFRGHLNLVKLLLENNADVDVPCKHGNTALFAAASLGFLNIVQYLHEKGARIDVIDLDGDIPLHDSAHNGHLSTVQYLVSQGANIAHKNKNGKTPLDLAQEKGHDDVVEFLKTETFKECHNLQ